VSGQSGTGTCQMDIFEQLSSAHAVSQQDVIALRQHVFSKERVNKRDLEKLLSVVTEGDDCKEWQWLLNEACESFFLKSARPHGYFCDESLNALTLLRGHNRANPAATQALVHVLNRCRAAPEEAATLAMELLETDILASGSINADRVQVLRDLLYAQGSLRGLGVSRREADMLFTIKDYLRDGLEDPDWVDLFCKAIGNHLMVQHGYVAATRGEALRQEKWLEEPSAGTGAFLGDMGKSLLNGSIVEVFRSMGDRDRDCIYKQRNDAFEKAAEDAAAITPQEAEWLASRIDRDGQYCAAEIALISYISALCETDLPAVLGRYAKAA